MKNIIKIRILSIVAVCVCFASCDITESIDDRELQFQLSEETVIVDQESATQALTSAYAALRNRDIGGSNRFIDEITRVHNVLSGMAIALAMNNTAPFTNNEYGELLNNSPTPESIGGDAMRDYYNAINRTNWVIEKVSELEDGLFDPTSLRQEILGEAYGLRALHHFNLLRNWGQWYDETSIFGITLRLEPIRGDFTTLPRNTVADTYAQIHSDLDNAIARAAMLSPPSGKRGIFITKQGAIAIKAKVYLQQGRYTEAASTAKRLLFGGAEANGANLSSPFSNLFAVNSDALFNNPGLLFGTKGCPTPFTERLGDGGWLSPSGGEDRMLFSPAFLALANTNAGITVGGQIIDYDLNDNRLKNGTTILMSPSGNTASIKRENEYSVGYYARLAETYLIFAEAEARSTNTVSADALVALNAVRIRAGATTTGGNGFETYPATIAFDQFLEAVRIEKVIELAGEGGEEWYDLVRYDWEDGFGSGFQVENNDFKALTGIDKDTYILPYTQVILQDGGFVEMQNPGY